MSTLESAKAYTIWPAGKDGRPGGTWQQATRWLVLDVTGGLGAVAIIAGPMSRVDALAESLRLRCEK